MSQVEDELEVAIPQAKAVVQQRETSDAEARKVYPALFDSKAKAAMTRRQLLEMAPGLNALPNVSFVVGDMLLGEVARAAGLRLSVDGSKLVRVAETKKGGGGPLPKPDSEPVRKAPAVPKRAGARGSEVAGSPSKETGVRGRFAHLGALDEVNEDVVVDAMEAMTG